MRDMLPTDDMIFIQAIQEGDRGKMMALITPHRLSGKRRIEVENFRDSEKFTALHLAVKANQPALLEELLKHHPQIAHLPAGESMQTPLALAQCMSGREACALMLESVPVDKIPFKRKKPDSTSISPLPTSETVAEKSNKRHKKTHTRPQKLRLHVDEIQFTQKSISPYFQDGSSLESLTIALLESKIRPEEILPIRVIYLEGQWWSLDNRRLRVFKDAMLEELSVEKCELADPAISKEFHGKRTNKTENGGGKIRLSSNGSTSSILSTPMALDKKQEPNGVYEFTRTVLAWNIEQLKDPLPITLHTSVPRPGLNARQAYYDHFKPGILEETRALLQEGLEKVAQQEIQSRPIKLLKKKFSNNPEHLSTLRFAWGNQSNDESFTLKPSDAILLKYNQAPNTVASGIALRLIALASYHEEDKVGYFELKTIITSTQKIIYAPAFEAGVQWEAFALGSVITHCRMYEACRNKPQVVFEEQLIYNRLPPLPAAAKSAQPIDSQLTSNESAPALSLNPYLLALNPVQQTIIADFLQGEKGIYLVQGPPGTGKTSLLVALLQELMEKGERVVVSAPSNKAVQLLALLFLKESKQPPPMLIVSADDKLPVESELEEFLLSSWRAALVAFLETFSEYLDALRPQSAQAVLITNTFIKKIKENLSAFINKMRRNSLPIVSTLLLLQEKMTLLLNHMQTPAFDSSTLRLLFYEVKKIFNEIHRHLMTCLSAPKKNQLNNLLLDNAQLIFATLSATGRKEFKEMKKIDSLIVDEAGQASEAETLVPFKTQPKKLMLVGDPKQLPALVKSAYGKKIQFNRSLLARLIEARHPYRMLDIQYRMHPAISAWPGLRYYAGELKNDPCVTQDRLNYALLKRAVPFLPYGFINVQGQERTESDGSKINEAEIILISALLSHLQQNHGINVQKQIGIISFYKGQADALKHHLQKEHDKLNIHTVDSFQGEETDYIILSLVRANAAGKIGFLADPQRLNVALTRARYGLIMVGHAPTLEKSNDPDLCHLLKHVKEQHCFFEASQIVPTFQMLSPTPISQSIALIPPSLKASHHI